MDRRLKNENGNALLFYIIGIIILGIILINNQFWIGFTKVNRSNLQNIIDKATRRASIELKTDTEEDLLRLGNGISFNGKILNDNLIIDRYKSKEAFFRILKGNGLNFDSEQFILLTPINISENNYSIYLEGKENIATETTYNTLDSMKEAIHSYLREQNKNYILHMDTNIIDKPTYLAIVEINTGKKIELIQSFGGGQIFRIGE